MRNVFRASLMGAAGLCAAVGIAYSADTRGARHDVLRGYDVTAADVRSMIFASKFDDPGPARPLHSDNGAVGANATVAALATSETDSMVMARGLIVARIDVDKAFPTYGLTAGTSYLWIDRLGPSNNPWRAVVVSADGGSRFLLGPVKYTPEGAHGTTTVADHARQYCGGKRGCFFSRPLDPSINAKRRVLDTIWTECINGCCERGG